MSLPDSGAAVLAGLGYDLECELKNAALRLFWQRHALPGRSERLVRSPKPRHYRTTSKRRCRQGPAAAGRAGKNGRARIFAEGEEAALLEPAEHALVFNALEQWLARPEFAPLARALHFVILRGTYAEFMVIFNFHSMDRAVNRMLQRLVGLLRELPVNIIAAFLFLDPGRSPYYLETGVPKGAFPIKRLFGPERFRLFLAGIVFSVPPTVFSQVNESLLPLMLETVRHLLAGEGQPRLLDLYCGYGLFTHLLRARYREIIAIDASAAAVRAGRDQLESLAPPPPQAGHARVTFKPMAISRNSLDSALPPPLAPGEEDVILDPPRRGAEGAVIRSIARRRPGRVLHLFCASEEIPAALREWQRSGYHVRRIVPLDMFAGTPQLETLVLLSPA